MVRRTGDRCVVLDNENDSAVVVMNLDEYERMLDEDEMCPCCGDDLNDENDVSDSDMDDEEGDIWPPVATGFNGDLGDLEDVFGADVKEEAVPFQAEEIENVEPIMEENVVDLPVVEPKDFANVGQEESLQDLPAEEADRFYLEPVDE